jgi:hypothetical protein
MSIDALAGAHVRANASNSTMIDSRFVRMKSDSDPLFPLKGASGPSDLSKTRVGTRAEPLAATGLEGDGAIRPDLSSGMRGSTLLKEASPESPVLSFEVLTAGARAGGKFPREDYLS